MKGWEGARTMRVGEEIRPCDVWQAFYQTHLLAFWSAHHIRQTAPEEPSIYLLP